MSLRIATGTDGSVKERKGLKRKFAAYAGLAFGLILIAGLFAGCGKKDTADADVKLSIFAAKSLNGVMDEICAAYTKAHPNVNFRNNYDSSGTLMAQIKEGAKCNIFFSAGVAQMDELQNGYDGGSVVDGTRVDLLNNQVCLVTSVSYTHLAEALRAYSMSLTPKAMLGRGASVIRKNTLIVNLPGSVKAVSESMDFLMGNIEHGLDILLQYDSECGR